MISPPALFLIRIGTPSVNISFKSSRVTTTEVVNYNEYVNINLLALSTTIHKNLFPAL